MKKINVITTMKAYFPLIDAIKDRELRRKVASIWYAVWQESQWKDLRDACFIPGYQSISLVDHTCSVATLALAISDARQQVFGETFNRDLLLAGALLHDVSKTLEYEPIDGKPIPTKYRTLFQHGIFGAHMALNEGLPDGLVHIIIAHTNKSRLIPKIPEAVIVYYADMTDLDLHKINFGDPLTLSTWK